MLPYVRSLLLRVNRAVLTRSVTNMQTHTGHNRLLPCQQPSDSQW